MIADDAYSVTRASSVDRIDICWNPVTPRDMDLYSAFPDDSHPYIALCQEDTGNLLITHKYEMLDPFLPRSASLMLRLFQETLVDLALTLDHVGWPLYDD